MIKVDRRDPYSAIPILVEEIEKLQKEVAELKKTIQSSNETKSP